MSELSKISLLDGSVGKILSSYHMKKSPFYIETDHFSRELAEEDMESKHFWPVIINYIYISMLYLSLQFSGYSMCKKNLSFTKKSCAVSNRSKFLDLK